MSNKKSHNNGGGGGCKGESTSIRVSRRSTCFKINKEL